MTAQPMWSPVDDDTADLLTVLADDGTVSTDYEWDLWCAMARGVARPAEGWVIDPNHLRNAIGRRIKPQRVGAFTHRALSQGLVEYTGEYVISTDTRGKNAGKPCRELRWIGGAS